MKAFSLSVMQSRRSGLKLVALVCILCKTFKSYRTLTKCRIGAASSLALAREEGTVENFEGLSASAQRMVCGVVDVTVEGETEIQNVETFSRLHCLTQEKSSRR
jgi:hypothetical protein